MEEHIGTRINLNRVQEALAQRPDAICVACPYCLTMITDGTKAHNAEEKVRTLDIAEILAKAIEEPTKTA